jgi:AAA domain
MARLERVNDETYPLSRFAPKPMAKPGAKSKSKDKTGSGHGFRFMQACRSRDDDYHTARDNILNDQGPAGEWARHYENEPGDRQIRRAWERAGKVGKTDTRTLEVTCLADVPMERIEWMWSRRLAIGKITILSGDPGLGKSHISIDAAARITTAEKWPLDEGEAPLGSVIILAGEDAANDTIRPRLEAAGADCRRVHLIKMINGSGGRRLVSLRTDLDLIEDKINEIGDVRLVIIDPFSAYLGDDRRDPNH